MNACVYVYVHMCLYVGVYVQYMFVLYFMYSKVDCYNMNDIRNMYYNYIV